MTTASISLTPGAALFPDGSTSNAAPALQRVKSSAAAPTPYFLQLCFDASAQEQCMWQLTMPDNYASGPTLTVHAKMTSATTGNVVMEGRLVAWTPADSTDIDAKAFAAANTSSSTAVPGTAGYPFSIGITLTNADSVAANDSIIIYLSRMPADAGDTAAGDIEVTDVILSYTTT